MNLEVHKPELVKRVTAHIQTGHFHDADELIEKALDALDALDEQTPPPAPSAGGDWRGSARRSTGVALSRH